MGRNESSVGLYSLVLLHRGQALHTASHPLIHAPNGHTNPATDSPSFEALTDDYIFLILSNLLNRTSSRKKHRIRPRLFKPQRDELPLGSLPRLLTYSYKERSTRNRGIIRCRFALPQCYLPLPPNDLISVFDMMFQRYILVILAVALCLVAATPVLPRVESTVQSRDGSATPTTYQAALSLVENSGTLNEEEDITRKEWLSSSTVEPK